ncbi:hypothetical protein LguiA_027646 [Lonicera macranthoides]
MTTTQDTNNNSTPPSSPTQLLLSNSDPDPTHSYQVSYHHGPRPGLKDRPFLLLFSLFLLSTFLFGILAALHRNPNSFQISSFVYDPTSTSCLLINPTSSSSFSPPISINNSSSTSFNSSSSILLKNLTWTLMTTLILSIPIVLFVLFLLKHYTKQVVYVSLPLFVVVPVLVFLYCFIACTFSPTCRVSFSLGHRVLVLAVVFFIIGLVAWLFVVNRHRVELTVRIIKVASDALCKNLGLFLVLPALGFGLFIYCVSIAVFLGLARLNGEIVVQEEDGEFDCVWKQDGWVPAYNAMAIFTMLWSYLAMAEAQVYVISGTIAQWYFSKGDSTLRRSIRSSLRNAFGPSSGTICLSGLLSCVVRMVRAAIDNARREDVTGTVNLMLQFCVNALVTAFDFLNKFTITFAAITGEAYCTSAKMTYELLRRNLLSAVIVETVSTRILAAIVLVLSAIYAVVVWAILKLGSNLGATELYSVAAVAWVVLMVVLGFFVHVFENVIHTIYICYAIDKDKGEVCKQDVHEVYVQLHITRNCAYPLIARTRLVV